MHQDAPFIPEPEAVRRELEAILGSEWLRKSTSLQNFLRFVVERTLQGKEEEIKEFVIGREVFHRGADYDPRSDAIVRVQARLLRNKLDQYYRQVEPVAVRIGLPKGGYVPVFVAVPASIPAAVPDPAEPLPGAAAPGRWWSPLARVLPALLLVGLGAFAWKMLHPARASHTTPPPLHCPLLWKPFFAGSVPTTIVLGTPNFFQRADGLLIRDINVNSSNQQADERRIQRLSPGASSALRPAHYYTGVGEALGAQRLARYFWRRSVLPAVAHSDSPDMQHLRDGNLIVISSLRIQTLVNRLHLPSDFVRVGQQRNIILNLHPRPGEQARYADRQQNGSYQEYGLVSAWPGMNPQRRILLLGGEDTYGTEAAVQFATNPVALDALQRKLTSLGAAPGSPLAFQALLRIVLAHGSSIQSVECVAVHLLPIGR